MKRIRRFAILVVAVLLCIGSIPAIPIRAERANPASESADLQTALSLPQYHYTVSDRTITAPTGVILDPIDGLWHLFYQYQDADQVSLWGHAVSEDLLHWQEQGTALRPTEGASILGGAVVWDETNTSGFFDGNSDKASRLVAIYTRGVGDRCDPCIAYSTDHGYTWTTPTMEGEGVQNPIIDNPGNLFFQGNSSLSVIRHDGKWLLVIDGTFVRLFCSEDLIHWTYAADLGMNNGCVEFFPMEVNGDPAQVKWVYLSQGGAYKIMDLSETYTFTAEKTVGGGLNSGDLQCIRTFLCESEGQTRHLAIGGFRESSGLTDSNRVSGLTLPYELSLQSDGESFWLCAEPIEESASLRGSLTVDLHSLSVEQAAEELRSHPASAFELEMIVSTNADSRFTLQFGKGGEGGIALSYDAALPNTIEIVQTAGEGNSRTKGLFISAEKETLTLRILLDGSCVELFANGGESAFGGTHLVDGAAVGLDLTGNVEIQSLRMWKMRSVSQEGAEIEIPAGVYLSAARTPIGYSVDAFAIDREGKYSTDVEFAPLQEDCVRLLRAENGHAVLQALRDGESTLTATCGDYSAQITLSLDVETNVIGNMGVWADKGDWGSGASGYGSDAPYGQNSYTFSTLKNSSECFSYSAKAHLGNGGLLFGVTAPEDPDTGIWYGAVLANDETAKSIVLRLFCMDRGELVWEETAEGNSNRSGEWSLLLTYSEGVLTFSDAEQTVSVSKTVENLPAGALGLVLMNGGKGEFVGIKYAEEVVSTQAPAETLAPDTSENAPVTEPTEEPEAPSEQNGRTAEEENRLVLGAIISIVSAVVLLCVVATVVWHRRNREYERQRALSSNAPSPDDANLPPRIG